MSLLWFLMLFLSNSAFEVEGIQDAPAIKLAECPPQVRKTFEAESKGAKIETVHKEQGDDETIYWAEISFGGKPFAIGVLEDGTLSEMNRCR